jgi:hypothetical protein
MTTRSLTRAITPGATFALAVVLFWALHPDAPRVRQSVTDPPKAHEPEHVVPAPFPTRLRRPRGAEPEMLCDRDAHPQAMGS